MVTLKRRRNLGFVFFCRPNLQHIIGLVSRHPGECSLRALPSTPQFLEPRGEYSPGECSPSEPLNRVRSTLWISRGDCMDVLATKTSHLTFPTDRVLLAACGSLIDRDSFLDAWYARWP